MLYHARLIELPLYVPFPGGKILLENMLEETKKKVRENGTHENSGPKPTSALKRKTET